jgi:predicted nucleic acid-binding protein
VILYLDASALVKRYITERGSGALNARFERGEIIYTSLLSFGEIHTAIARAYRMRRLAAEDLTRIREAFLSDWLVGLSPIEVNVETMTALPGLVENYPLKAADAIHLSAAFWLWNSFRLRTHRPIPEHEVEFGVADQRLGQIALKCGLQVFNPEDED